MKNKIKIALIIIVVILLLFVAIRFFVVQYSNYNYIKYYSGNKQVGGVSSEGNLCDEGWGIHACQAFGAERYEFRVQLTGDYHIITSLKCSEEYENRLGKSLINGFCSLEKVSSTPGGIEFKCECWA